MYVIVAVAMSIRNICQQMCSLYTYVASIVLSHNRVYSIGA